MPKPVKESTIRSVKFTYVGTDADVNNFIIAIVKDYLIKNELIDQRAVAKLSA